MLVTVLFWGVIEYGEEQDQEERSRGRGRVTERQRSSAMRRRIPPSGLVGREWDRKMDALLESLQIP